MRSFVAAALAAALLPTSAPAQTLLIEAQLAARLFFTRLPVPPALDAPGPKLERIDGWAPLFDGGSLDAWRSPDGSKWHVVNGMLYPEGNKPALLVSRVAYPDYELSVVYYKRPDSKVRWLLNCDADGRDAVAEVSGRRLGRNWGEVRLEVSGGRLRNAYYRADGVLLAVQDFNEVRKLDDPRPRHVALSGSGLLIRSIHIRLLDKKEGQP
jgi:hypothetical protein